MAEQENTREEKKSRLRSRMIGPETEHGDDMEQSLRTYRRRKTVILVVLALILVIAAAAVWFLHKNRTFTECVVEEQMETAGATGARLVTYRDGVLRCSMNGVSYINASGQILWNASYDMRDPMISVCGSRVAVADRMGYQIMLCDEQGQTGTAKTTLPITRISVSQSGVSAVVMEDAKASYVDIYAADGARMDIEIKALLTQSGYPIDAAISPNGQILAVAYVYFNQGTMMNQVVFYNFDEEGKEYVDRVVGGFKEYEQTMIGEVTFLSDQAAVVFADDRVDFYSLKKSNEPALKESVKAGTEIQSIAHGLGRAAVVTLPKDSAAGRVLTVYGSGGGKLLETTLDFAPEMVQLTSEGVMAYAGKRLVLIRDDGKVRFDGELPGGSSYLVPVAADRFLQIDENGMKRIRLK